MMLFSSLSEFGLVLLVHFACYPILPAISTAVVIFLTAHISRQESLLFPCKERKLILSFDNPKLCLVSKN